MTLDESKLYLLLSLSPEGLKKTVFPFSPPDMSPCHHVTDVPKSRRFLTWQAQA